MARTGFVVRSKKRPRKKPDSKKNVASGKARLQVTVSIGVASRNDTKTTPENLIKAADKALYKAKKGGRN
ncbi:MAG: diguanylate cyclase, partial [Phycisphaerae bacterium]|nr:diguanylate cyclase [Phycisphaerae bacterium]NIX02182.1 diguanylate cyclase [Phycisphaerae bacterium]